MSKELTKRPRAAHPATLISALLVLFTVLDMERIGFELMQFPVKVVLSISILLTVSASTARNISWPRSQNARLLLGYIVLALFSLFWSIDLRATSSALAGLVVICACLLYTNSGAVSREQWLVSLFASLSGILLLNYAMAPIFGDRFFDFMKGVWRFSGFTYGSLALARLSVFTILIGYFASELGLISRASWISVSVLATFTIFWADARQAQAALVIVFVFVYWFKINQFGPAVRLAIRAISIFALVFAAFSLAGFDLAILARDGGLTELETLNGRVFIWEAAAELIGDKPFSGFGFGAGSVAIECYYVGRFFWTTGSAHNLFLHGALDLGLIGGTLITLILGSTLVSSLRTNDQLTVVICTVIATFSLVESSIAGAPGYTMALLFMPAMRLRRGNRLQRLRQPSTSKSNK